MLNSSTSLVIQAAKSSGYPSALIQAAAIGYAAQLRHMPPERAAGAVMMELPIVAQAYGGRHEIDDAVYKECVKLILSKFPGLGVNEIREAYRMKAAGELNLPKGKGEMWGGEFNANQLGEVLAAYMEVRRRALGKYLNMKQEQKEAAEKAERAERMQREYLEKFPELIAAMIEKANDWRDCSAHYFDEALRLGMIQFAPGEAQAILEDARELARMEHEQEIEEAREAGKSLFYLRSLERLPGDYGLEGKAKVIARKLSLFRKLKL